MTSFYQILGRHSLVAAFQRSSLMASRQQLKAAPNRKLFSTAPVRQQEQIGHDDDEELLHPTQFFVNGAMPPPKSLSPSSIIEFKSCPQSYLFQYIFGLRQGTSRVLAKGSMIHSALEKLFDLHEDDRTLENLQNLFRSTWAKERTASPYKELFEDEHGNRDLEAEIKWGKEGLKLLENYMREEDPSLINPAQREIWVTAHLHTDPFLGVTAASPNRDPRYTAKNNKNNDTFYVRGIVDRLDLIRDPETKDVELRVCDYKTGKAPNLKYSPACNERIREESFFQLKIYALLMRENIVSKDLPSNLDSRHLRLFYLTKKGANEPEGDAAKFMDLDLGATQEERDEKLFEIHQELANVWKGINELCALQDALLWKGCDRSFCYCHQCRKRFAPGTVWQPSLMP